ncbi:hypothetical protein K501DRAFT_269799 [Backusella circina FSU 941]|nr:hypothetical protein K501DRAFT_269799 [Backusella circina FSU 941]
MNPSQDTVITINEKTLVQDHTTTADPPSYDSSMHDCPPNYIHSTRLLYQNEPYISGFDTWTDNDASSVVSWSDMNELPFRQRMLFYVRSWASTMYDCRFIFFVLSVCCSLAIMFVVFSLIVFPNQLVNKS